MCSSVSALWLYRNNGVVIGECLAGKCCLHVRCRSSTRFCDAKNRKQKMSAASCWTGSTVLEKTESKTSSVTVTTVTYTHTQICPHINYKLIRKRWILTDKQVNMNAAQSQLLPALKKFLFSSRLSFSEFNFKGSWTWFVLKKACFLISLH